MSWLLAKIYDRFMAPAEDACLREWRQEVVTGASGRVLEIGAGTGANLDFYGSQVERLTLVEPDPHMREQLAEKVRNSGRTGVEIVPIVAEALPASDATIDTVVSTLVLCSVDDPGLTLREAHRVLRSGGELRFLEHVGAHDNPGRRKWQERIEPMWKIAADGCHLTRETAENIERAGFEMVDLTRESMRKAWPILRPTVRGVASKP
ncbi:MAG: class I SAM-dependent methyltransferase [Myxococcota bacterium]